jgi:Flp pilus assembly pilin Flp
VKSEEEIVKQLLLRLWNDEQGQDIAEYAVMLAVVLVIVIGTVRQSWQHAQPVVAQQHSRASLEVQPRHRQVPWLLLFGVC